MGNYELRMIIVSIYDRQFHPWGEWFAMSDRFAKATTAPVSLAAVLERQYDEVGS